MNLIYGIPAVLILIESRAQIDAYLIEKKNKYVNHTSRALIQSSVMILASIITNYFNPEPLTQVAAQTLTYFAIFWLLFDIRLNTLRKLHWLYVPSKPDHRSAKTDRILRALNLTGLRMLNLKLFLIVLFVGVYYN